MATLIHELGNLLDGMEGFEVEHQAASMLVRLPVGQGRKQTVKVWTTAIGLGANHALRLQSRAAVVAEHKLVRAAMKRNAGWDVPALALDTSVTPHTLDVVHSLVAEEVSREEFLDALQRVAWLADAVEEKIGREDRF